MPLIDLIARHKPPQPEKDKEVIYSGIGYDIDSTDNESYLGTETDSDIESINASNHVPKEAATLTSCELAVITINAVTIRPCNQYLVLFQSYLINNLNFTMIDIGHVVALKHLGGIVSFIFPIIITKINRHSSIKISYRYLLTTLHLLAGVVTMSYLYFDDLFYYMLSRFLYGILIKLFASYKLVYIAQFTKNDGDLIIKYALTYLAWPATIFYLIGFGFLLKYTAFEWSMLWISAPLVITSLLLLLFLPNTNIDETQHSAKKDVSQSLMMDWLSILFDLNRGLKIIIGFYAGFKMAMFTIVLSSWFQHYFNLNSATYYTVLLAQAISEVVSLCLTIVYKKWKTRSAANRGDAPHDSTAIFLYTLSKLIGSIVFGLIYISHFTDKITISYPIALIFTGLMYFSSMLRFASGATLNMEIISQEPHKRAIFISIKKSVNALGNLLGTLCAVYGYEYDGMKSVSLYGTLICSISFGSCCLLWFNMKKHNIIS
eukprot:508212_1